MASVLLDTNVIVSGVISDRGAPWEVLAGLRNRAFEAVTSAGLMAELERALRYPRVMQRYELTEDDVRSVLALFWRVAVMMDDPQSIPEVTGDPADDLVLAVCSISECDYLVTGDRVLLQLGSHHGTRIITPRSLVESFP